MYPFKHQQMQVIFLVYSASFFFGSADSHPFNTDFVGLLPCLILLSISVCLLHFSNSNSLLFILQAITMVGVYLFADPDDPTCRTFTWSELSVFSSMQCVYDI